MATNIDELNRTFDDPYEALDHCWRAFGNKSLTDEQRSRAGKYICEMSLQCWKFEFYWGNRS